MHSFCLTVIQKVCHLWHLSLTLPVSCLSVKAVLKDKNWIKLGKAVAERAEQSEQSRSPFRGGDHGEGPAGLAKGISFSTWTLGCSREKSCVSSEVKALSRWLESSLAAWAKHKTFRRWSLLYFKWISFLFPKNGFDNTLVVIQGIRYLFFNFYRNV